MAFTVCNDSLFVATSRNFLLRHDLAGDSSTGAPTCTQLWQDHRLLDLVVLQQWCWLTRLVCC